MSDLLGFELNVGSMCNFRCKYCFEGHINYQPTKLSYNYLQRYAEYIKFLKVNYYPDDKFILRIYGGEPLLQYDILEKFILEVKDYFDNIVIITNGSLIDDILKDKIKYLHHQCEKKLSIAISYDFSNQDIMRQKGSSQKILNAIKWLYKENISNHIMTVFSKETLYTMDNVFFDYIKLQKEMPDLSYSFAIDRSHTIEDIDFIKLRRCLGRIKSYIIRHPEIKNKITHRSSYGNQRRNSLSIDKCLYGDIFIALCYDGNLYPGYDIPYESEFIKKTFYIGHITEDFTSLEHKRLEQLKMRQTNINECCKKCNAICRVYPWKIIKTNINEWWDIPKGQWCELHKLISDYFNI